MLLRKFLIPFAALVGAVGARAAIEFVGVLVMPSRSLFALTDDAAKPATWRALGQEFAGYALAEFDAKADTLVLQKNGAPPLRLHLKDDAKIKNARLELAGTITAGPSDKLEVTRVTLPLDQETALPLKDGVIWHVTPQRRPDGNLRWDFSIERTGVDGKTEKLGAPSAITRPETPFKMVVGEFEFAFAPVKP